MILSYGDRRTKRFALGGRTKQFESFRRQAEKTLDRLDAATSLRDVANFPGHRLEKLSGDVPATTASASTTNGESVSLGAKDHLDRST